ncbi:jacalin-related lectin 23-like [Rosa chinensis]|uniref:jacalin-related lectin 23-like n=1 Tax=Rosa chinensis TaxID=74649 RepID=UPI001AD8FA1C|nr:jacalin-related lectin 23-like [Rosa chinensis]
MYLAAIRKPSPLVFSHPWFSLIASICLKMNLIRFIGGSSKEIGPGEPFDDGSHLGVMELVIRYTSWLDFIQIKYDDGNGISSWSERRGCHNAHCPGGEVTKIKLDYPDEVLTGVSGYIDTPWSFFPELTLTRSITFKSNKRIYGPFGAETGKHFSLAETGTMIVGFYGWSEPKHCIRSGIRKIGLWIETFNSYEISPSKDLLPAGYFLQSKLKEDDGDTKIVISDNKVIGNKGKGNGKFVVGKRTTKNITNLHIRLL